MSSGDKCAPRLTPKSELGRRCVGTELDAKYVGYQCADGYYGSSIDMPTALHPQTIMAVKFADATLPVRCGYPFKLRIPTKLGFKNPKRVTRLYYNWFGGS